MDPQHKTTVRTADQTVHGRLAKSRLATLLATVQALGDREMVRIQAKAKAKAKATATGGEGEGGQGEDEGITVSLHTLLYRLGYNVNCTGLFGPQLDPVATRVLLQSFTESQHELFNSFNWPLPLWLTSRVVPGARRTVRARKALYEVLYR